MAEMVIEGVIGQGFWGDVSSSMVRDQLREIAGDVTVYLNSVGGDVFEGISIMNQLKRHEGAVEIHVDGLAASIASVIAMGGDQVTMGEGGRATSPA